MRLVRFMNFHASSALQIILQQRILFLIISSVVFLSHLYIIISYILVYSILLVYIEFILLY